MEIWTLYLLNSILSIEKISMIHFIKVVNL
nr:MAG TPA: hypothetical protein [Bacteriophage sp.]